MTKENTDTPEKTKQYPPFLFNRDVEFARSVEKLFRYKPIHPVFVFHYFFNIYIKNITLRIEQTFKGDELNDKIKSALILVVRGILHQPILYRESLNEFKDIDKVEDKDFEVGRLFRKKNKEYSESKEIEQFKNEVIKNELVILMINNEDEAKKILKKIFIIWDSFLKDIEVKGEFYYSKSPLFIEFHKTIFMELKELYTKLFTDFNYPHFIKLESDNEVPEIALSKVDTENKLSNEELITMLIGKEILKKDQEKQFLGILNGKPKIEDVIWYAKDWQLYTFVTHLIEHGYLELGNTKIIDFIKCNFQNIKGKKFNYSEDTYNRAFKKYNERKSLPEQNGIRKREVEKDFYYKYSTKLDSVFNRK